MSTITIYLSSADLTLSRLIFEGVAMMCKQTTFIFGFAVLAAMWHLFAAPAAATVAAMSSGNGSGELGKRAASALIALILGMLLTSVKCTVQLESTLNGKVTAVDNVPYIIAIIPGASSLLSKETGALVSTAFQSASAEYTLISAGENGFLNPLKTLLASRTAILRLGGVESQVKAVVAACLGPESAPNYAEINRLVMHAGNTGATAAQTVEINEETSTGIGALLYQAAQNGTAYVENLFPEEGNILTCPDAVARVQTSINSAINSAEFARVMQNGINGMDQPITDADRSIDTVSGQYSALVVANAVSAGKTHANAEMLNLMFSELLNNEINCLQTEGEGKQACSAAMVQATEIERGNIQAAANEVPMLKYAGSFGNYILALIIGLGPVIVMFMMLAGVNAGKSMMVAVHIMVWPLLVMNVGAELVNGMIVIQVSNFLTSLRSGGMISPAQTYAAYKELSLQIGTGSHIMASLPVLMSMIFGLSAGSAMVSVAQSQTPHTTETKDATAPSAVASAPVMRESSPIEMTQGLNGGEVHAQGMMRGLGVSAGLMEASNSVAGRLSESKVRQRQIAEGQNYNSLIHDAISSGDWSRTGFDQTSAERISKDVRSQIATSEQQKTGTGAAAGRQNVAGSQASGEIKVAGEAGTGGGQLGVGAGGGFGGNVAASDTLNFNKHAERDKAVAESKAISTALQAETGRLSSTAHGTEKSKRMESIYSAQKTYSDSLTGTDTISDDSILSSDASTRLSTGMVNIDPLTVAQQGATNRDFSNYMAIHGREFEQRASAQQFITNAKDDVAAGSVGSLAGNPVAQRNVTLLRSAAMLANDKNANTGDRVEALAFLSGAAGSMTHTQREDPQIPQMKNLGIDTPENRTKVDDSTFRNTHLRPGASSAAPKRGTPHPTNNQPLALNESPTLTEINNKQDKQETEIVKRRQETNGLIGHAEKVTKGMAAGRLWNTATGDGKEEGPTRKKP